MYFMNSDGTINTSYDLPHLTQTQIDSLQPTPPPGYVSPVPQQNEIKTKENFRDHLYRRRSNCNCNYCWKNFILMTVFYAFIIYFLYLISKFLLSSTETKEEKTI
uniref:Uncharacterized protein n=1 Tax=viral metagenome TaxID=1070528 RepID=A0A6C0E069_9ZZZZ